MSPIRLAVLLAALLAAAAPAGAAADEPVPPAGAHAQAEELRARATRAYDLQKYGEAAELFAAAYELDPQPGLLYAIGQARRLGGDCLRAIRSYEAFLRSSPPPRHAAVTREQIALCRRALATGTKPAPGPAPATAPTPVAAAPPPAPPPAPRWWKDPLGGVLFLGGLATAITGTVLWVEGHNRVADARAEPTYGGFEAALEDGRAAQTRQRVGTVVAVSGGALVAAGIIRYVLKGATASRATAEIAASRRGIVVGIVGDL